MIETSDMLSYLTDSKFYFDYSTDSIVRFSLLGLLLLLTLLDGVLLVFSLSIIVTSSNCLF